MIELIIMNSCLKVSQWTIIELNNHTCVVSEKINIINFLVFLCFLSFFIHLFIYLFSKLDEVTLTTPLSKCKDRLPLQRWWMWIWGKESDKSQIWTMYCIYLSKLTQQVLILYKRTIPESLTPTSDQDRISPYIYQYNINQINDENKEK